MCRRRHNHDLRHSYATHLVSRGIPVNDVQAVMGHERASATLNFYTHPSAGRDDRIRSAFDDDSLTTDPDGGDSQQEDPPEDRP